MSTTRYIKNKNGQFAGSIGAGKTTVPSVAPTTPAAPAAAGDPRPQWAHGFSHPSTWPTRPKSLDIADLPDYWADGDITRQDITQLDPADLLPRPGDDIIDSWPTLAAQEKLHTDMVLMANLVSKYSRDIDAAQDTYDHAMHCDERAAHFYNTGQHYQAQAYEWAAAVGMHCIDYLRDEDPASPDQLLIDAHTVSKGAVLLDYLPAAGYDAEAAAVLSHLS